MEALTDANPATVEDIPNAIAIDNNRLIYEYQNTDGQYTEIDAELLINDSSAANPKKYGSVLQGYLNNATKNGEDAIYLLVSCVTPIEYQEDSNASVKVYTSLSAEKAPSVTVKGSTLFSEVVKTGNGYTYKVGKLNQYTQNAILIVAAYDNNDKFITAATTGAIVTTEDDSVDIVCNDASTLRAYIWKAGTLEPVTYVETIAL